MINAILNFFVVQVESKEMEILNIKDETKGTVGRLETQLKESKKEKEAAVDNVRKEVADKLDDLVVKTKQVAEMEKDLEKANEQVKFLEGKTNEMRKSHEEYKVKSDKSMADLMKENATLHKDYKKACELADTKASETTDLLNKLEESESEVDKTRHRLEITEEELATVKGREWYVELSWYIC